MLSRSRRAAHARPRSVHTLMAVLIATLVTSACSTSLLQSGSSPSPSPSGSAGDLDVSGLRVPRTDFCGSLSKDDVNAALDGSVRRTAHYGNGDEFEVRPGYVDVSHEYGCVFEGADGTAARAWVFARPVAAKEAQTVVRRARRQRDCAFPDSVRFGRPGLTSVCEVPGARPSAPAVRARLEGLFRDSWLACEVSEPLGRAEDSASSGPEGRTDVLQRAQQWCTALVTTVAARP